MAVSSSGAPPMWVIFLLLVVVQVGFGGYSIVLQAFAKNEKADSLVFSMLRDAFCAPVLIVAATIVEKGLKSFKLSELPFFFLLGLTGMFGNQLGFIEGLYFSSPDVASIFQPLIPVFTAFFAFLICMERLPSGSRWYQWFKVLGIVLGAGGAIVMTLAKSNGSSIDIKAMQACNSTADAINTTTWTSGKCEPTSDIGHVLNMTEGAYAMVTCNGSMVHWESYADKSCQKLTRMYNLNQSTCHNYNDHYVTITCPSNESKNKIVGIIFLIINCSSMAFYVLLQKRYIFDGTGSLSRWSQYPVHVTAWSYLFGAICMALAAAVRYMINGDKSVFIIKPATFGGLAYAVLVSSALCYGLITYCNKHVSSLVVTASWPLQVFVTVILSWLVFNIKLVSLEYVGMALIMLGMFCVAFGNFKEQKAKPDFDFEGRQKLLVNERGKDYTWEN
eukprot:TRINITY_DN6066_c0_g1_i1.p1 TRINITY_DN6066_c0_g1~~TRINITY_DN6066_c0_g1_i1.p1  ORF type:complete len:446 (+),score=82.82 TRINITY_DN6066_c0_g1_i1:2-1339(+)